MNASKENARKARTAVFAAIDDDKLVLTETRKFLSDFCDAAEG